MIRKKCSNILKITRLVRLAIFYYALKGYASQFLTLINISHEEIIFEPVKDLKK